MYLDKDTDLGDFIKHPLLFWAGYDDSFIEVINSAYKAKLKEAEKEIIEARMDKLEGTPSHSNSPLLRSDIVEIQTEYKRLIDKSTLGPVVRINTSVDNPEQSLEKLAIKLRPHFTQEDLRRTELQTDNV